MDPNRDQLVAELRAVMGRMEAALGVIEEAIGFFDAQGRLKWCNEVFVRLTGKPRILLLTKPVTELLPLERTGRPLPVEAHPVAETLARRASIQGDYDFGPESVTLRIQATYMGAGEDAEANVVLVARDVSGEQKLEQYRLQAAALDAAANAIVIMEFPARIIWCNPAFTAMTGYTLEEVYGRTLKVLKSGRQDKAFYTRLWSTILAGRPWQGELVNRRKDGGLYHEHQTITPILAPDGKPTHFIVIKQDVSERFAAQHTLAEREARLSAVFHNAVEAIITADTVGTIENINPAAERIFGYEPDRMLGMNVRELTPPELRPHHDEYIARYLKTHEPRIIGTDREAEAVRKDGSRFPIELSISEITVGEETRFTALVRDITERKANEQALKELNEELETRVATRTEDLVREIGERRQAEKAVREGQEMLRAILEGVGGAFLIFEQDSGRLLELNDLAKHLLGLKHDVLGQDCSQVCAHLGEESVATLCVAGNNTASHEETTLNTAEGRKIPVARHVLPIDRAGIPCLVVVLFDISERRNLERKLSIAQKLESIGQLASGIAHEINTPIQYVGDSVRFTRDAHQDLAEIIAAYAELAERCGKDGLHRDLLERIDELTEEADMGFLNQELPKAFERALDGVGRVTTIVKAMKNFSHPGGEEKRAVNLNEAIQTTVTVARNEWKYVANVELELDPELPAIQGLPGDLNQVILNVVVNAAHAIEAKVGGSDEQGVIRITTRREGDHVLLAISDTGVGIPKELQTRVFDPFFTTKEVGKGTGQGLAITHDVIVGKHGGGIDIDSQPGKGTTFTLRLPIQAAAQPSPNRNRAAASEQEPL